MASNYDLRSSLLTDQQKQDVAFLKKLGAQQTAQNFISAYMSPNELSDLHNRLGTVIASTDNIATVSDYSFPPYNLDSTHAGLGVRVGGFKALNDKINQIQSVYRLFSGEIRTKITEWDLSLYLQELWIDDLSMFDLSLLYRIFTDNPSGYSDSRALSYGIINAALNYKYKSYAYNPAADPDLVQWAPPTKDLLASQIVPKGHYVTTKSGGLNIFGWRIFQRSVDTWVWDVPPPEPINAWQQNQINLANAAGWTSWTPSLWQLFFDSDNPANITSDDFPAINAHLDALYAARHAAEPAVAGVQPGSSLFTAQGAPTSRLGLNLLSPFWYGFPYGRYPDSRSIQGYFNNTDLSIPKIDIVENVTTSINTNYSYGNPVHGLNMLLNGWTSTYPFTTYIQQGLNTYNPSPWAPGATSEKYGTFSTMPITVPVTTTRTSTGRYPNVSGVVTIPSSNQRSIIEQVFGFFGKTTTTQGANGRSTTTQIESWGTQNVNQTINTSMTLQINSLDNDPAGTITTLLSDGIARPVIIVGAPTGSANTPAWVVIAPIQKVQITSQSSRTAYFLWWSWTVTTTSHTWVYQIDMSQAQGFSIDTGATDIQVAMPHLPLQYFARGAKFQGMYFDLPGRTMASSNDDFLVTGWSTIAGPTGKAIATALLNPMWWNGTAYVRAPFRAQVKSMLSNVLLPLQTALGTLSDIFSPSSGPVIENIISQLPVDIQAKQSMQNAVTLFSNSSTGPLLTQIETAQNNFATLLQVVKSIIADPVYRWGLMQTFYSLYPQVVGALLNPTMIAAMRVYLDVLYEQRLMILSARINKETGTLINVARIEIALALMQDSLVDQPSPVAPLIPAQLRVVHFVTNIPLMDKATTDAAKLPVEKTKIVYVLVQHTDKGNIIRPPAGEYKLFSKEVLAQRSITPAQWYITFVEGDPNCPNIIKDVITTLDGNRLQQIMTDASLTQLEKICYARSLEDWWEIKVPEDSQPMASFYQNNLQLILTASDTFIEQYVKMTGSLSLNPVVESATMLQLGVTWAGDPAAQAELKLLSGSS